MKVRFVGTGSISSLSNSASLLINDSILIDCGNGIHKALLRQNVDIKKIKYVFITHLHGDHIFDIAPLLFWISNNNPGQTITFVGNISLKKTILSLLKLAYPLSWKNIYEGVNLLFVKSEVLDHFKIADNLYVDSFLVHHGKLEGCFGYIINGMYAITGDCSYDNNILELSHSVSHLICDCTRKAGDSSHMVIDNVKTLASYSNLTIYTTHMGVNSKKILASTYFPNHNVFVPSDSDIIFI